ncbi:endopeptidase La [Campylobacter sp. RM9344]|uniref:Lon protease n=1 Tax=Campylobacter californiensis TaxID=1032243 RepID=A0AAW3ZTA3_9BACT|nr:MULTISPECIES: endopeptidase La [unclassified Campylobacter]MBE2984806.1 endopeptidase La [Campylobacter sp. RM6883]MBE2994728.1 endopeptidase La [Campylobacter sp. RM6913]MBE3029594.1 endopeptidase La [Campylobacter sp. RM9344]MBE3608330.1 endopeptidase La [Campylobacter sp. RM9337]QCD50537.1 DNA-binding, ATP-dependent protease La [Campylobacter sp. RM6914]
MQINDNKTLPAKLPVIVEDELFLYPFMITPLFLSDEENLRALDIALADETPVLIVPAKPQNDGARDFESVYDAGVIGTIMRRVPLPDGRVKILFQGMEKGRILHVINENPLEAMVDALHVVRPSQVKTDALIVVLREKVRELAQVSHFFPPDLLKTIEESAEAVRVCDLVSSALRLKKQIAYSFFIEENLEQRLLKLIDYVIEEIEANKLQKEIKNKVHSKIDKTNKEYFLKEQLKQIQAELGADSNRDEEIEEYRKKLESKKKFMGEDAYKEIKKQIDKLSRMHPDSADANTLQSYLDWVVEVPFENLAKKKSSIAEVSKHLNADHYSLEKPKERIEEYFALRELLELRGVSEKVNNGAILCFAGPPGVGKTSLANSIAKALKRELVRIALGGLEDVNELRGHRRTYIGAMPGRIVQGLIEAKQMNPVVVLDEIDKVGRSYRGDPTAVLLEILDPEQNNKFRDYYLNFNIDLSKVIFIATANDVSQIPAPLRDRMEFIQLSSYTPQEKFEIAKKYLVPQELKKHGLKPSDVSINKEALELIISDYTRESGVRNLRRRIADILRKVAKNILTKNSEGKVTITAKNLKEFLEKKVYEIEQADKKDQIGQVNGLAWTSVGGDVLRIEAIRIQGKGVMQITGQLGDVMKESAQIAFSVVKVLIDNKKLKVPMAIVPKFEDDKRKLEASDVYRRYDLHVHVPEGATPKDGPSAGITMVTAIASILTDIKVRHDVAMTGEITLSGKVLPIGGLKEKLIAAHKAGIKTALIPRKNYERDLNDIPDEVKKDINIIAVDTIEDVLKNALVK